MYHKLGWCLGVIAQLITVVLVILFFNSMITAIYYTQARSYRELTQKVLSPKLGMTLDIFNYINTFGVITAYIVIGSNGITQFLKHICKFEVKRTWIVKIIIGVIEFPLTMLKQLTGLGKIASYSTLAIVITGITIWVYFFMGLKNKSLCSDIPYGISAFGTEDAKGTVLNFLMYVSVFQTMYLMHNSLAPLQQELIGPKIMRKKILNVASCIVIAVASTIYIVTGITGATTFNYAISDNIINTYSDYCGFVWPNILFIVYSFVVMIAYPLILFPIKQSIMQLFANKIQNKVMLASVIVSLIYIVVSVFFACEVELIISIFGVFCSFTGIIIEFGVPLGIYIKLPEVKEKYAFVDKESATDVVTDPVLVAALSLIHPSMSKESINSVRRVSMALFNSEKDDVNDEQKNRVSFLYPRKVSIDVNQDTNQVNIRQSSVSKIVYRNSISSKQLEYSQTEDTEDLIVQNSKTESGTQVEEGKQDKQNVQPAIQTKLQEQLEEQDEISDSSDNKQTVENNKEENNNQTDNEKQLQNYVQSDEVKKQIKCRSIYTWILIVILTIISLESVYMNMVDIINSFKK